ncbi:hypothetical protein VTO42DRAFT_762 [Malbranchea cinnamomea]
MYVPCYLSSLHGLVYKLLVRSSLFDRLSAPAPHRRLEDLRKASHILTVGHSSVAARTLVELDLRPAKVGPAPELVVPPVLPIASRIRRRAFRNKHVQAPHRANGLVRLDAGAEGLCHVADKGQTRGVDREGTGVLEVADCHDVRQRIVAAVE